MVDTPWGGHTSSESCPCINSSPLLQTELVTFFQPMEYSEGDRTTFAWLDLHVWQSWRVFADIGTVDFVLITGKIILGSTDLIKWKYLKDGLHLFVRLSSIPSKKLSCCEKAFEKAMSQGNMDYPPKAVSNLWLTTTSVLQSSVLNSANNYMNWEEILKSQKGTEPGTHLSTIKLCLDSWPIKPVRWCLKFVVFVTQQWIINSLHLFIHSFI